jgi:hypothetical protein
LIGNSIHAVDPIERFLAAGGDTVTPDHMACLQTLWRMRRINKRPLGRKKKLI